MTDAGNEWAGIPPLTEKYGFVWKRKNVALTGHGAMARLDRTVRTLRYYMEMLWLASEPRENNWYKLFQMAVWVHNNSAHRFSYLPPQYLICAPDVMGKMRKNEYRKKVGNYRSFYPYIRIIPQGEKGNVAFGLLREKYFVEVNRDKPEERYRYGSFIKGRDRHLYNTTPRELRYLVGNKFMLRGDDLNTEREPDEVGDTEFMTISSLTRDKEHILKRTLP